MPAAPLKATLSLLALLVLGFHPLQGMSADAPPRPNVLLILADDLGYSDLGCYGGEIHTPHLNLLARNGLRFTQFYNCSRCCPTRASLLSGLYPHQAGMGGMVGGPKPGPKGYEGRLTDRCVTIPQVLHSTGYRCYMVGKWHLNGTPNPIDRGFDEFYGMIGGYNSCWQEQPFFSRLPPDRPRRAYPPGHFYSTDVFADYALGFLADARTKKTPWFLYLAFNAPHFPLHAPEADIARYERLYQDGWDIVRERRLARQKELGLVRRDDMPLPPRSLVPANRYNGQSVWADKPNPAWKSLDADRRADLARRMAVYAAMVDRMDGAIGRVVHDLERHDELDNTLILFLSDNGACAEWDPFGFDGKSGPDNVLHRGDDLKKVGGPDSYVSYGSGWANACNTPWRLYKHYIHEGGISTPLVVHWPRGIAAKGALRTPAGHVIDILPTLVEVCGARYPAGAAAGQVLPLEGRSLVPAFAGKPLDRPYLAWEHEGNRAVRTDKWKLVGLKDKPWELYDLDTDRVEQENLAAKYPEQVRALAAQWDKWADRCFVFRPKKGVTP
jgi:arylsulfatase